MMGGGMMGSGGFGSGFGSFGLAGGLIGLLFNVVILIGLVLLVIWAVRKFSGPTNSGWQSNSPQSSAIDRSLSAREILQTRYAKGELTREEYQTMLSDVS